MLDHLKQRLLDSQKSLKYELAQYNELKDEARDLVSKETEQARLLETSTEDLNEIKRKLKTYEETTKRTDDHSKFAKAVQNVQQAQDLTELTMLALRITEE